jgi:hypothetical protein
MRALLPFHTKVPSLIDTFSFNNSKREEEEKRRNRLTNECRDVIYNDLSLVYFLIEKKKKKQEIIDSFLFSSFPGV